VKLYTGRRGLFFYLIIRHNVLNNYDTIFYVRNFNLVIKKSLNNSQIAKNFV